MVSVPIRGLFNLTHVNIIEHMVRRRELVSVPIRGLFNLTIKKLADITNYKSIMFPSPSGDYLI